MKVILSPLLVPISVTPVGRGSLPLGPKDHTNVGAGTLFGRDLESLLRVDEHINEYIASSVFEPEVEVVT